MNQFSAEFQAFINQFAVNKGNDLQFSNSFMPKRVETVVVDLTTARDSGAPLEIKVPFNAVHVESIYTTASGAATTGTVKISFDYGDIASIQNCKTLSSNDSFTVDKEVSKAFITNTAQSGVSARIAFMTDIDYRPGATQSVITSGNVAISSNKYPVPSSIEKLYSTNGGADATYTVPAGYYAIVQAYCIGTAGGSVVYIGGGTKLATEIIATYFTSGVQAIPQRTVAIAGEIITATSSGADSKAIVRIEVYPV